MCRYCWCFLACYSELAHLDSELGVRENYTVEPVAPSFKADGEKFVSPVIPKIVSESHWHSLFSRRSAAAAAGTVCRLYLSPDAVTKALALTWWPPTPSSLLPQRLRLKSCYRLKHLALLSERASSWCTQGDDRLEEGCGHWCPFGGHLVELRSRTPPWGLVPWIQLWHNSESDGKKRKQLGVHGPGEKEINPLVLSRKEMEEVFKKFTGRGWGEGGVGAKHPSVL